MKVLNVRTRWGVTGRAVAAAMTIVALALGVSAVVVAQLVSHFELRSVDHTLTLEANTISSLVRSHTIAEVRSFATSSAEAVQVMDPSGRVVASSADLVGEGPLVATSAGGHTAGSVTLPSSPLGSGEPFRVRREFVSRPDGTWIVLTGESIGSVVSAIRDFSAGLLLTDLAITLIVGLLVAALTRRALRPVAMMRARVDSIATSAVHQRVPEPTTHDEIGHLARTMNAMLARLEGAEQRQRRFISDASHELKSPLAAATTELSVATAHANTANWTEVATSVLGDLEHLRALVEDLLVLARIEESPSTTAESEVDLDELVREEVIRLRRISNVRIDLSDLSGGRIHGDRTALRRLVRNLLDNALAHAHSLVRVAIKTQRDVVELDVTNDGPSIDPAQRQLIFERFARLDSGRSREIGGSGLGLAIVAAVATAHHANVEVRDAHPGTTFVVAFPHHTTSSLEVN